MQETPRSEIFDDIYFSPDNGVAETKHVFLNGNHLPQAWQGKKLFRICETGFGTGLNFFCTWALFEASARHDQCLEFVSIEKYPLKKDDIRKYLFPLVDKKNLDVLLDHYPLRVSGIHQLYLNPNVVLTLIFDDINKALPELDSCMDAWFLDGFAPAKNPEMWTYTLYENMARLSAAGTNFSTFTAAGHVKRGLDHVGFEVEKVAGYGRKRDMLRGYYRG